jgi:hypothetical protein
MVCEDFVLANIIVRSDDDFTIVGVVDLEWTYAGPAQRAAYYIKIQRKHLPSWQLVSGHEDLSFDDSDSSSGSDCDSDINTPASSVTSEVMHSDLHFNRYSPIHTTKCSMRRSKRL